MEILRESGSGVYTGADERPGVYDLLIDADGFAPRTVEGFQVEAGRCHVDTVNLEITLSVSGNGN